MLPKTNKLAAMLPFGIDKAFHFGAGAFVYLAVRFVGSFVAPEFAREAGLAASYLVGAAKEGLDWLENRRAVARGARAPHTVDVLDFIATCLGGTAAYVLLP